MGGGKSQNSKVSSKIYHFIRRYIKLILVVYEKIGRSFD